MHKHLCWIGRGTYIRGTQHDNKLQHEHTQQDINGTVITCVHTCHLWESHVFTLFVCGMQRIHKHKTVGCALTESLARRGRTQGRSLAVMCTVAVTASPKGTLRVSVLTLGHGTLSLGPCATQGGSDRV